uniref:Heat shock protein binding protein n=1 Tax=Rhizophora mucronata TaxID=61149 RepID=A0A2P2LZ27_RHIMU
MKLQELLLNDNELSAADIDQSSLLATALRNKRLTFSWLDGEAQHKYCLYYLHSETSYETCGPRRGLIDIPRLFIILYKKNTTQDDVKVEGKWKNVFNLLEDADVVHTTQLVSRYNGSNEIPEIIQWISRTIQDGDTRDIPIYDSRVVHLVPEDSDPIWSRGAQSILSRSSGIKHKIYSILNRIYDCVGDPRIGPILLLGALISAGTTWLRRNQGIQSRKPIESTTKDETNQRGREGTRNASRNPFPSITDQEPKDAYQMPLSDSD